MSKSKRCRSQKTPLKVDFSLQKPQSHQSLRGILDYKRVKTRIPEPSYVQPGYVSRRSTSLLTPRIHITASENGESVDSGDSPKVRDQRQAKLKETFLKDAKKLDESPRQSVSGQNQDKHKTTRAPRSHSASARIGKSDQFPGTLTNTIKVQVERTKSPGKAAKKSEKSLGTKPEERSVNRRNVSRKGRIIGGGSEAPTPSSDSPKSRDLVELTETLCKAAKISEKMQLENFTKSKPEALKCSCCDGRSARRESCVSFTDPVAAEIHYCDPSHRNCSSLEPDQLPTQTEVINPAYEHSCTCSETEQKNLPKRSPKATFFGKGKRPVIVVPLGEGNKSDHKESSSSSSIQTSGRSNSSHRDSRKRHSVSPSNSKLKSLIPYSRNSFPHVDSLKNLHVSLSGHKHNDPSLHNSQCPNCAELSKQMDELTRKLQSLEATVKSLSQKPEKEHKPRPSAERKGLTTCEFCRGRNLPILDSFKRQLKETIGNRSFTDVVMSIFLRADNIYHVNIRELKTGCSLACFLVTDDAISEVQQLGLFREILTFSVIDVRNTLKPKNYALGITFELVDSDRQKGGSDPVDRGLCLTCKPFLGRVLGLPLNRLRHVYTDPGITTNYLKKTFQESFARIQACPTRNQKGKLKN